VTMMKDLSRKRAAATKQMISLRSKSFTNARKTRATHV
jgi:hypothetical protein